MKWHLSATRKRSGNSGEAYITHPLNTAIILADMGSDEETVCAGLLHDAKDSEYAEHLKETEAGRKIWKVLLAYREFERMHECEDERGLWLPLPTALHNMRTIEFVDPSTWKKAGGGHHENIFPHSSKIRGSPAPFRA